MGAKKMKIKVVALFGKAGSGKDTILREVVSKGDFHEIVSCTTRPRREGEQDGVNYHFLTNEEFTDLVLQDRMLEATVFRDWCYGTALDSLDYNKINIGVWNPEGLELLIEHPTLDVLPIYITADDKIRLLRQLNREAWPDCHEIVRRFGTDEEDFKFINERFPTRRVVSNGTGILLQSAVDDTLAAIRHWTENDK